MIEIAKLTTVMDEVLSEKGETVLFALLLREDAPDKWDLVVAGPWFEQNEGEALRYLSQKLAAHLSPVELLSISRVVILEGASPAVKAILRAVHVERADVDIRDTTLFGLHIKQAHILRAVRPRSAPYPNGPSEPSQPAPNGDQWADRPPAVDVSARSEYTPGHPGLLWPSI